MNPSAQAVVRQLLDAMTVKDRAGALAFFADDAVFFDPHYPTPLMVGKEAIGAGLDFSFRMLKQPGWIVNRVWEADGSVVLEVDTQHELMNGIKVTPRQVFIVDVADGKIAQWQSFVPYPPPPFPTA